jgi:hypothetical protein
MGMPISLAKPFAIEKVFALLVLTLSHLQMLQATAFEALGGSS